LSSPKKTGKIYFTDASSKWNLNQVITGQLEGAPYGLLLEYDPHTKETVVLATDLYFANGVALSPDEDILYFCETFVSSISKLWLSGPKKGKIEPLISGLPGSPDNLMTSPRNTLWVAMPIPRDEFLEKYVLPYPPLKRLLYYIPESLVIHSLKFVSIAMEIAPSGKILRTLVDSAGKVPLMTSAYEHEGYLYIGTLEGPFIGRLKL